MQREAGAVIGGVYSLRRRLKALSWLAGTPDGDEYVLKFFSSAPAGIPEGVVHPALIRGEWIDETTVVRPFFRGETAEGPDLPVGRPALAASRRLAEALLALHTAKGVHGNLKPSNIIFRATGSPVMVDATGEGSPQQDVAAVARIVNRLLRSRSLSDHLRETLEAAEAGECSAGDLHDALDDELVGAGARAREPLSTVVTSATAGESARPSGVAPRTVIIGSVIVALLLLVGMFLILPAPGPEPQLTDRPPVVEPEPEPEPEPELTEAQLEQLLAERQAAQAVLDEAIALRLALEEQSVERWGRKPFETALDVLRSGDDPFRSQDYVRAREIYADALERLTAVTELGRVTLENSIAAGAEALVQGRSEAAAEAFELALAIDPGNAEAQAGAARAAVLDDALALQQSAASLEEQGRLEEALTALRELANLDPEMPGTEAAIKRVSEAIVERNYRQAMSDGLAAMEISNWSAARKAFERAAQIRPSAPAPGEYMLEIEQRARAEIIDSHRRKALAAISEEKWAEALAHYEAALKREPKADFALQGKARVEKRLALDRRLQRFIENPSEWWSDEGRSEASALLATARRIAQPGKRLAGQIEALAGQIRLASEPVPVRLVSDNSCNVVVYKVARLGSFDQRELELKPGRYTVVATRDGYRDVRKRFLVPAGETPPPVVLKCEDPV